MHKTVDGEQVPLTENEILEFQERETKWENERFNREMDALRLKRDEVLKESDYLMMPDYPMLDKSNIESYRQALRDLPQTISTLDDLNNVVWPAKPF